MRYVYSAICPRHGYHEGDVCPKCDICGVGEAFNTPKDKLFEFTDVHTTGQPIKFTSKRQWEQHLKATGKHQLSQTDIKKLKEYKAHTSDYREVVKTAWKEREKYKMDRKYGRVKVNVA